MNLKIDELDSDTVVKILKQLATADPGYAGVASEAAALSLPPLPPSQQADLAKQTLLVLSEDPQRAQAIAMMARGQVTQRFDIGLASAALLVCIVTLLRTHVEYEKRADGRSKFKIIHKPVDSKLLTELLKKISLLLPGRQLNPWPAALNPIQNVSWYIGPGTREVFMGDRVNAFGK